MKEALACDLPVVATRCGDIPERLRGVSYSHLCSQDPRELGARLVEVVSARQRSNGRAHVLDLDIYQVALAIAECYKKAIVYP